MAQKKHAVHSAHRQRFKARFLKEGLDHFEDHNVLELLLFFGVPQADTNPLAHRLMERYGSFSAVFDAPIEDLRKVEGVGEHVATLIKLIPALARRYCADRFACRMELPTYSDVGNYFVAQFLGRRTEAVWGLFYSASFQLLESCELSSGGIGSAALSARGIAERAILCNARYLILGHNHPGGVPMASLADWETTRTLRGALADMEITLIDHFIIAEGKFFSLDKGSFDHVFAQAKDVEEVL